MTNVYHQIVGGVPDDGEGVRPVFDWLGGPGTLPALQRNRPLGRAAIGRHSDESPVQIKFREPAGLFLRVRGGQLYRILQGSPQDAGCMWFALQFHGKTAEVLPPELAGFGGGQLN